MAESYCTTLTDIPANNSRVLARKKLKGVAGFEIKA